MGSNIENARYDLRCDAMMLSSLHAFFIFVFLLCLLLLSYAIAVFCVKNSSSKEVSDEGGYIRDPLPHFAPELIVTAHLRSQIRLRIVRLSASAPLQLQYRSVCGSWNA